MLSLEPNCRPQQKSFIILACWRWTSCKWLDKDLSSGYQNFFVHVHSHEKCYHEVDPPHPLNFWHFPLALDVWFPADFNWKVLFSHPWWIWLSILQYFAITNDSSKLTIAQKFMFDDGYNLSIICQFPWSLTNIPSRHNSSYNPVICSILVSQHKGYSNEHSSSHWANVRWSVTRYCTLT